mmetsp:Transcript_12186/g.27674  ORF Transcript_12186/g.27674 Transcript_12186/m.27674 type:complete len:251 (-) Transcript_12186:6-758(-)
MACLLSQATYEWLPRPLASGAGVVRTAVRAAPHVELGDGGVRKLRSESDLSVGRHHVLGRQLRRQRDVVDGDPSVILHQLGVGEQPRADLQGAPIRMPWAQARCGTDGLRHSCLRKLVQDTACEVLGKPPRRGQHDPGARGLHHPTQLLQLRVPEQRCQGCACGVQNPVDVEEDYRRGTHPRGAELASALGAAIARADLRIHKWLRALHWRRRGIEHASEGRGIATRGRARAAAHSGAPMPPAPHAHPAV